jgi:hypothetical protein
MDLDARSFECSLLPWAPDNGNKEPDADENDGFKTRKALCSKSRKFQFYYPLLIELFQTGKLLPNRCQYRLELTRASDSFCIETDQAEEYKLHFTKLEYHVLFREYSPSLSMAIEKLWMKEPVKFSVRTPDIRVLHLEGGRAQFHGLNLCNGVLPRKILCFFIQNEHYLGAYNSTPFRLQHFKLKKAQLSVGGFKLPSEPLELETGTGNVAEAYKMFLDGLRRPDGRTLGYSKNNFLNNFVLVFDCTADLSANANYLQLIRTGSCDISLEFAENLPAAGVKMLAYIERDRIVECDSMRNFFVI